MAGEVLGVYVSRRSVLRGIGLSAAGALLAACAPITPAAPAASGASSAATPSSAPASGASAGQPRTGGTLRYGIVGEPANLDAHQVGPLFFHTTYLAHDRLTRYDEQLQPQPMLAESWDLSADAKQIKLNLRKGVQFHSGRELTSDDIKWNILRVRDPQLGLNQLANQSNWWTSIETPDKYTVVLASDQSRPTVFDFFELFNIIDRDVADKPDGRSRVGGTGPYSFAEWVQGSQIRYTKNKNYWQSGKPYLDEVVISVTKDQQAAVTLLEGAGLDVLADPASRDINRLSQDPNYRAVANDRTGQYFDVIFNCTKPPTDNKLFRQAVNYAIDRRRLADTILAGTSKPRTLPWPAQAPAYDASKANAYAFDLDKARTLLAQSGVSNSQIDIVAQAGLDALQQMAQVLQSDLAKIGVRATVKPMEFGAMGTTIRDKTYLGIVLFQSGFAQLESSSLFTTGGTWNYQSNNAGFSDDTYKALVTQVSVEPNAARRKQLYSQLNDLLLDQAFTLALASNTPHLLARSTVQGLGWFASEAPSLGEAWLAA